MSGSPTTDSTEDSAPAAPSTIADPPATRRGFSSFFFPSPAQKFAAGKTEAVLRDSDLRKDILTILQESMSAGPDGPKIEEVSHSLQNAVVNTVSNSLRDYFENDTAKEVDPKLVRAVVTNVLTKDTGTGTPDFTRSKDILGRTYEKGKRATTSSYGGKKALEDKLREEFDKAVDDPAKYVRESQRSGPVDNQTIKGRKHLDRAGKGIAMRTLRDNIFNEAGRRGVVKFASRSLDKSVNDVVKNTRRARAGKAYTEQHDKALDAAITQVLTRGREGVCPEPDFKKSKRWLPGGWFTDKSGNRASRSTYGGKEKFEKALQEEIDEALENPGEYLKKIAKQEKAINVSAFKSKTDKELLKVREDIKAIDTKISEAKTIKQRFSLMAEKEAKQSGLDKVIKKYAKEKMKKGPAQVGLAEAYGKTVKEADKLVADCKAEREGIERAAKFIGKAKQMTKDIIKTRIYNEYGSHTMNSVSNTLQNTVQKSVDEAISSYKGEFSEARLAAVEAAVTKVLAKGTTETPPNFRTSKKSFGRASTSGKRASRSTYGGEEVLQEAIKAEIEKALEEKSPEEYKKGVDEEIKKIGNKSLPLTRTDEKVKESYSKLERLNKRMLSPKTLSEKENILKNINKEIGTLKSLERRYRREGQGRAEEETKKSITKWEDFQEFHSKSVAAQKQFVKDAPKMAEDFFKGHATVNSVSRTLKRSVQKAVKESLGEFPEEFSEREAAAVKEAMEEVLGTGDFAKSKGVGGIVISGGSRASRSAYGDKTSDLEDKLKAAITEKLDDLYEPPSKEAEKEEAVEKVAEPEVASPAVVPETPKPEVTPEPGVGPSTPAAHSPGNPFAEHDPARKTPAVTAPTPPEPGRAVPATAASTPLPPTPAPDTEAEVASTATTPEPAVASTGPEAEPKVESKTEDRRPLEGFLEPEKPTAAATPPEPGRAPETSTVVESEETRKTPAVTPPPPPPPPPRPEAATRAETSSPPPPPPRESKAETADLPSPEHEAVQKAAKATQLAAPDAPDFMTRMAANLTKGATTESLSGSKSASTGPGKGPGQEQTGPGVS